MGFADLFVFLVYAETNPVWIEKEGRPTIWAHGPRDLFCLWPLKKMGQFQRHDRKRGWVMKQFVMIMILIFALPFSSFAGEFKVTRVYDGNTLQAEGHDIEIEIRLVGIDAPETSKGKRKTGQPYSQKAKEYLAALVLNRTVDVKGYGMGPYNRILGVIHLNGKNVNLEMVKAGLAEVYRGLAPHKFKLLPYWQAEKQARDKLRGMWALGDKYISPKDWRRLQNGK